MNENTIITYENAIGKVVFAYNSPFWVSEIDVSSVEVDISESRNIRQVGSSIARQSVQPRAIPIDGCIYEPLSDNRKHLLTVVAPEVPATLTVSNNGESWYLEVTPVKTPQITPGNGIQYFQMELHAAYPYWRSSKAHAAQIVGLVALFKFPFFTGGTWKLSKLSENLFATVMNQGNIPIEFRVTFTARSPLSNPELYHVDTNKKIVIKKSMVTGEMIVVSTIYGKKGVTCISPEGMESNGFRYLSTESDLSMTLSPGENLLRVDAQTNRSGLGARIDAPEGVKSGV